MSRNGFRCFECDGKAHHAHHIIPLAVGGKRTVPLCDSCHSLAHGMNFEEHSKRTKEGIAKARANGGNHGRKLIPFNEAAALELRNRGWYIKDIASKFGVGKETMRRRLELLKDEDS